jgi:hypothetical protein
MSEGLARLPPVINPPEPDLELGSYLFELWLAGNGWVRRRVETVDFLGAGTLSRRVSVDFEIPRTDFGTPSPLPVPLALLEKRPLVDFDVFDEAGNALPVFTRAENAYAAWSMLAAVAAVEIRDADGDGPLEPLWEDFRSITSSDSQTALEVLDGFGESEDRLRRTLAESSFFNAVARTLATFFLLLVPVEGTPGQRRVIKFRYTLGLRRFGSRPERFCQAMGWMPAGFEFYVPAVGESQSYHFELAAPTDLQVARSILHLEDPVSGRENIEGVSTGTRAHLYTNNREPDVDGTALVWLQISRTGLLRSGCVVAGMILAVLLFFYATGRLDRPPRDIQSAILLTLPALVATLVVRPGEHGLVTELLLGVRSAVALAGAVAYTAALLLGSGTRGEMLYGSWKVLLGLSSLCFVSLFLAFLRCKPKSSAAMIT